MWTTFSAHLERTDSIGSHESVVRDDGSVYCDLVPVVKDVFDVGKFLVQ